MNTNEKKPKIRCFGGFATAETFKEQTEIQRQSLKEAKDKNLKVDQDRVICVSYDTPFKAFGRRNEVILFALD